MLALSFFGCPPSPSLVAQATVVYFSYNGPTTFCLCGVFFFFCVFWVVGIICGKSSCFVRQRFGFSGGWRVFCKGEHEKFLFFFFFFLSWVVVGRFWVFVVVFFVPVVSSEGLLKEGGVRKSHFFFCFCEGVGWSGCGEFFCFRLG